MNKLKNPKGEEMIEIKKQDIDANQYDDEYYNTEPFVVITPKRNHEPLDCKDEFCKHDEQLRNQLKKQILQDHEDAKVLPKAIEMVTNLRRTIIEYQKDRQIVQSIKSYVDLLQEGDPENEEPEKILDNIDKILEEKK